MFADPEPDGMNRTVLSGARIVLASAADPKPNSDPEPICNSENRTIGFPLALNRTVSVDGLNPRTSLDPLLVNNVPEPL